MNGHGGYAVFFFPQALEALGEAIKPYLTSQPDGPHIFCREIDTGGAVFVDRVENFGNTSSASIPLALGACVAEGSIPLSGRAMLVAYGSGEAWGGVAVDYDLTDTADAE